MAVSLRDTIPAAVSFGVAGVRRLGVCGALPRVPLSLSFAVWRIGRGLFAATGIRLGGRRLRLGGGALFGWLGGCLARGPRGGLLGRFGGPTDSGGPTVICSVGHCR